MNAEINDRAELDGLPDRTVILTRGLIVLRKWDDYYGDGAAAWERAMFDPNYFDRTAELDSFHFPVQVLWEPQS